MRWVIALGVTSVVWKVSLLCCEDAYDNEYQISRRGNKIYRTRVSDRKYGDGDGEDKKREKNISAGKGGGASLCKGWRGICSMAMISHS